MATEFAALSARERIEAILDPGSLELCWSRDDSPLVAGLGRFQGRVVGAIATDGHRRGGTFGVTEASAVAQVLGQFGPLARPIVEALLVCLDTGGVRVEEGPRALAATSAAGVLLAQWSLIGPPVIQVISGPRGCFGAPAVMAALPDVRVLVGNAYWGLTGPQLLSELAPQTPAEKILHATSPAHRVESGDAQEWVGDSLAEVREAVHRAFAACTGLKRPSLRDALAASHALVRERRQRHEDALGTRTPATRRRRRLLEYSLRRQWVPEGRVLMAGLAQAAWGRLGGRPALGVVLGPENSTTSGVGVEEVALVLEQLCRVRDLSPTEHALILNCIFCQGHSLDVAQEELGLPRILAECLRSFVAVRLLGHRLISVLGGGTYGAAFLAFAAPSHRVLAIRGTKIAPMAPELLRAFQRLKGKRDESEKNLAELIPEVKVVESVLRLPRALQEEIHQLEADTAAGVGAA